MNQSSKICKICGRQFNWRKKWQHNWHQVQYCSRACRQAGLKEVDLKLEKTIIELLRSRGHNASICPREAAIRLAEDDDQKSWRSLLEPARRAARRLAHRNKINITQGGKLVDPSKFSGPIQLTLKK
ncbi:MAG: DUF3253 domain-containing protein [Desulfobacterales bacterium]|jgi:hypothetical protein